MKSLADYLAKICVWLRPCLIQRSRNIVPECMKQYPRNICLLVFLALHFWSPSSKYISRMNFTIIKLMRCHSQKFAFPHLSNYRELFGNLTISSEQSNFSWKWSWIFLFLLGVQNCLAFASVECEHFWFAGLFHRFPRRRKLCVSNAVLLLFVSYVFHQIFQNLFYLTPHASYVSSVERKIHRIVYA